MGKCAQLVIGPAGSGKSTYCEYVSRHCELSKRTVHVVNLDPAAEELRYEPAIDIRQLISVADVMKDMGYGPNGALLYAMEYLVDNIDWLIDELNDYDDDYLIFDCPGQIELYSHIPVMKSITEALKTVGYQVVAVYLMDSHFITETTKYVSGVLSCLSTMIHLELPHLNVLTKVDLLGDQADTDDMEKYYDPDISYLMHQLEIETGGRFTRLNQAICNMLDEYSMVHFIPMSVHDTDTIELVLAHADHAIQYGEDLEPKEPRFADTEPEEDVAPSE